MPGSSFQELLRVPLDVINTLVSSKDEASLSASKTYLQYLACIGSILV